MHKGQASVEFMIVLGLGMLILLPATLIFVNFSQSSNDDLKISQAVRMGSEIVNSAETVYYYSDPSRLEVQAVMPEDVHNITIQSDWANHTNLLTFHVQRGRNIQPITFFSRININASFEARDMTAGKKRIVMEVSKSGSGEPYVSIDFQ